MPTPAPDVGFAFEEEIDRLVSLGLDASLVIKAYKCTNMNKTLTGMVLEQLCRHEPIPEHQGVWTTADDAALRYIKEEIIAQPPIGLSAADRERRVRMLRQRVKLAVKHGENGISLRRQFLEDWVLPEGYSDTAKEEELRKARSDPT